MSFVVNPGAIVANQALQSSQYVTQLSSSSVISNSDILSSPSRNNIINSSNNDNNTVSINNINSNSRSSSRWPNLIRMTTMARVPDLETPDQCVKSVAFKL